MERLLAGLHVLVTRPAGQGESLAAAILEAGGRAVQFPLLTIQPVQDPQKLALIRQRILDLDHYQILIFISTNAARFGLEWIDRCWPQFPVGIEVVAVGPSTAAALSTLPCPVQTSPAGMQSEDILQLPVLTRVDGQRIALFRGVGGRELLAETLRQRGARVDYLETYERREPETDGEQLLAKIRGGGINVVTVTSDQMLGVLVKLIDIKQTGVSLLPLLVPSERIRQAALNAGFVDVFRSDGATDQAIVSALADFARQRCNSSDRINCGR